MEAHLINAAISAIKARYGYERIQLAGLSGSGALSIRSRARALGTKEAQRGLDQTGQPLSAVYDPVAQIGSVKPDARRRIFVVGDPLDRSVAFDSQKEFQEKLAAAGIPATVLTTQAKDKMHHRIAPKPSAWPPGARPVGATSKSRLACSRTLRNKDMETERKTQGRKGTRCILWRCR